jgi:Trk-type K+ transport system membrane component
MKVTTFILLGFVMWAEIRGDPDVNAFGRRIPTVSQRQAVTVTLSGIGFVVSGILALLVTNNFPLVDTTFEAVSAIGTVGLSTGVSAMWGTAGKLVLVGLMFLGRLGPLTLATALALRQTPTLYRYPEEQPLIG